MEQYLEFKSIGKVFPGVRALGDISFKASGGKVLALLGENGAGKSTLLKILSGDLKPDEGQLLINGQEVQFSSPNESIDAGISVIYQERQLFPQLSVAENLFPGQLPKKKLGGFDKRKLYKDAQVIIDRFGLDIDPSEKVGMLNVAYQQMVEIRLNRLQNHYYGVIKLQIENRQYYFEKEVEEIAVLLYQLCTGRIPVLPFDMISSDSLSKSFVDKINLILQKSTKEGHQIKYH